MTTRRQFLIGAGASASLILWPRFARAAMTAADTETRLLVVLLRGGLDGLHAVQPYADPHYKQLRAAFAEPLPAYASQGDAHRLDGLFALHPALTFSASLYANKQLLPVVAVAPPYRQRSHFEAQDCLENGTDRPGGANSGWLNRCVSTLQGSEGLALASAMPLIMRGPGSASTWSPPLPQRVAPDLLRRLEPLYAHDAVLAAPFAEISATDLVAGDADGRRGRLPDMAASAAKFMAAADGPRIGFLEDSGWDTHGNQAGTLARKLAQLDAALQQFHDGLGAIWKYSTVMVLTEFGRTAAINGTGGTDHGTGGMALLAGGAVSGGRIAGDWPGLAGSDLRDGRDLRATCDTRALCKGVLAEHLGVTEAALAESVFPNSAKLAPMDGLIKTV